MKQHVRKHKQTYVVVQAVFVHDLPTDETLRILSVCLEYLCNEDKYMLTY